MALVENRLVSFTLAQERKGKREEFDFEIWSHETLMNMQSDWLSTGKSIEGLRKDGNIILPVSLSPNRSDPFQILHTRYGLLLDTRFLTAAVTILIQDRTLSVNFGAIPRL